MKDKQKIIFYALVIIDILLLIIPIVLLFTPHINVRDLGMLDPKGIIASKQLSLLVKATLLMLILAVPIYILTFLVVWKFKATNNTVDYEPNRPTKKAWVIAWWGALFGIILVLGVMIVKSTHELDPYKPIVNGKKPITIQVVAMEWKWLFIYPEQNIATVNFLQFPENTPVNFELTADAAMNSFWIPQLGGQMYAMTGMTTKLNLMAKEQGVFAGSAAELSGKGFAGMKFDVKVSSEEEFNSWVNKIKKSETPLTFGQYENLAKPSENVKPVFYSLVVPGLYDSIIMKFMVPNLNRYH